MRVRERKLPKWYWCDPGLVRAIKRSSGTLIPEETGPLFEGLVAQLLRAYRDYRRIFDEMYYWAPAGSVATEVDFLLLRNGKSIGYWCIFQKKEKLGHHGTQRKFFIIEMFWLYPTPHKQNRYHTRA